MDLKEILKELKKLKGAFVTFHSRGDLDACSSGYVLAKYFNFKIIAPDAPASRALKLLQRFGKRIDVWNGEEIKEENFVIVDANSYSLFPPKFSQMLRNKKKIVIDHHQEREDMIEGIIFNSSSFNSSSSIVFEILKESKKKIEKNDALLLLFGIVDDSADFRNSNPKTFEQIAELLRITNYSFYDVYQILYSKETTASLLEELKKIEYKEIFREINGERKKAIIALGIVKENFETRVAEILLSIGCNVAIIGSYSRKERKLKVSLRALNEKYINLATLANRVGWSLGGSGGGHKNAAGIYWNGRKKDLKEVINFCYREVVYELKF
ncbi:MAG: DHH family phosphoesterase [Candidatus Micrarchaeia archaeon]